MIDENETEKCVIANHVYPKGLPSCPWCYVEDKMQLLRENGTLQADFTYSSYTKLYKKSVSATQTNTNAKQSGRYSTDNNYGDIPSIQHTTHPELHLKDATVPPQPISSGKKTLSIIGCIGAVVIAIIGCVVSCYFSIPLISIGTAILFAILAIFTLPRSDSDDAYQSIVEFPDYITVKCKEKKEYWYVLIPKSRVNFTTFVSLSVMICLCVATVLGFNKAVLWPWIAFSLLSIFNTFYVTEKRTFWSKTVLGIIIGVFGILTILLSIVLFIRLLLMLFVF